MDLEAVGTVDLGAIGTVDLSGGCWHTGSGGRLQRTGHPVQLIRAYIWLSRVGPKLNVGTKIREVVSDSSSPGHFG